MTILLEPLQGDAIPGGPLFAVNWFDTRVGWLYDFYNLLAAVPLRKVGGRPLFKGRRLKTLSRRDAGIRDRLLIVRYPGGGALLDLLQNGWFQAISLLRLLAVRRFSFVLHNNLEGASHAGTQDAVELRRNAYAVHHFRSRQSFDQELARITGLVSDQGVRTFFAGEATATLSTLDKNGVTKPQPFITHKLVLFEAESGEALEQFLCGAAYSTFTAGLEESYTALLERTL
jgi:hypothetical protein